ncbi:uncharacterized protein LOC112519506 isoform X2 [Cynara cardunculus var. scolymus]|uniref:uncharacterized protein LOC112519506 isoform X2 n=1 Tax=Cynara cardunculus var. scolymus TaxID=59895 RepID=UPI000D62FB9C|nr:uncharacterized protein LOC112519506 isoform X2 [Cynara cardunculus var. scolymus]
MHQKKSEVQIGKDSSGVSSDFNPNPIISSSVGNNSPHKFPVFQSTPHSPSSASSSSPSPFSSSSLLLLPSPDNNNKNKNKNSSSSNNNNNSDVTTAASNPNPSHQHQIVIDDVEFDPFAAPTPKSTPHKRPLFSQTTATSSSNSLTKSPILSNPLKNYTFSSKTHYSKRFCNTKAAAFHFLHRLRHLRRLRTHLRLILLLSLPFFYFLVSHPSHSFLLDFLSAFAFSTALLFSLNLALPRLPSIRLFLARSFPIKLYSSAHSSRPHLPVFWSIGSRQKGDKRANSGCWVQAYTNGDVYEGEFHKGFIREMFMLVNGRMVKVMDVEFILAKMVAVMWENSSGVLNMVLATIISEMGIHMLESISQTRCMALECIVLQMGIDTKDHGMKEEGKDLGCTVSEMGRPNLGTGRMGFLMSQAHRVPCLLYHRLLFIIPKCLMQFRKHEERLRKHMM